MITVSNEASWTREAIDAIEVALGVEQHIGVALGDDDLSHVPTFGALVDLIAQRP